MMRKSIKIMLSNKPLVFSSKFLTEEGIASSCRCMSYEGGGDVASQNINDITQLTILNNSGFLLFVF